MVKVNGELYDFNGINVDEMLVKMEYKKGRVAVELNYEIVPKAAYETTTLKDEDVVEVVQFVGGG